MSAALPYGYWGDDGDDDGDEREHGFDVYGHGFPDQPDGHADTARSSRYPTAANAICPKCGSKLTRALQWGRKFGCILGAVAGAAGGAAAGCIGAPRLPVPSLRWVSLISSAVIGGISGGTAGCKSGASLGDLLDERILPNHQCQDCSKRFCHPKR